MIRLTDEQWERMDDGRTCGCAYRATWTDRKCTNLRRVHRGWREFRQHLSYLITRLTIQRQGNTWFMTCGVLRSSCGNMGDQMSSTMKSLPFLLSSRTRYEFEVLLRRSITRISRSGPVTGRS